MGRKKKAADSGNSFPAKYAKVLTDEWMKECDSAPLDDIKKKIIDAETAIEGVEMARDADNDLNDLKLKVKEMSKDYRDDIFAERAKIKYLMRCLESLGQPVTQQAE